MKIPARLALILAGMLLAALPETQPAAAQASCMAPGQARDAVQGAPVIPLSQLRGRIAVAGEGEVVSAQLCMIGGHYVYVVNVLTRRGVVRRFIVDAYSGAVSN